MKLSHQILFASTITLAAILVPRLSYAVVLVQVGKPVNLGKVKDFKATDLAKKRLETEIAKVAP